MKLRALIDKLERLRERVAPPSGGRCKSVEIVVALDHGDCVDVGPVAPLAEARLGYRRVGRNRVYRSLRGALANEQCSPNKIEVVVVAGPSRRKKQQS